DYITDVISRGKRKFFSLLGLGSLTGGLSPLTASRLYTTYSLNTMLYGCAVIQYTPQEVERLEIVHREIGRRVQNLPKGSANPIATTPLGLSKISRKIDIYRLMFFWGILSLPMSNIYKCVAIHRLVQIMNGVGHSMSPLVSMWNTVVRYNMRGSVVKMLGTAQYGSKFSWSKKVKMIVGNSDLQSLRIMCSLYSSLKWYCESLTTTPTLCPTIWWKICQEFPMMKKSCQLMLHLQTGCFRFSESMCPCCNSCYDTIEHFMLHCEALADVRRPLAIFFNEMHLMSNDQKMRMSLGIQVSIDDIDTLVFISGIVTQMYTKRNSLISYNGIY
ncbi:unnamed protein product, partial [Owenia fusiformis]